MAKPATSGLILPVNDWTVFRWNVQHERSRGRVTLDGISGARADLLIRVDPKGEPQLSIVGPEPIERTA